MRFLRLLVPTLLIAGCHAVVPGEDAELSVSELSKGKSEASVAWGPCVASRADIIASVSKRRGEIISRGFTWLDDGVRFNMQGTYQSYRTDCSGFVSMAWDLGAPGLNTRGFGGKNSDTTRFNDYDQLVPADALVRPGHHSFIFLGWNDKDRKGMCVLEQSSSKNHMQFRVRMTETLRNEGFIPMRRDDLWDDTEVNYGGGGTAGNDVETPPVTNDGGTTQPEEPPNTDEGGTVILPPIIFPPYEPPVCISDRVETVCADAVSRGYECGLVQDNCGRVVDCTTAVPGYGCENGQTCGDDYKCSSACTVKYPQDKCYTARMKDGVQCGKIPDGCGGEIDCDQFTYFGCAEGETCSANKCPSNPNVASEPDPFADADTGDETDSPSSTRTPENEDALQPPAPRRRGTSESAGCSAAPGSTSSETAGLAGLALGLAAVLGRRRRPRA